MLLRGESVGVRVQWQQVGWSLGFPILGAPSDPASCDWGSVLSSHNLTYVIIDYKNQGCLART